MAGSPEKWDALSGKRSPLFYVNRPEGTEVRLDFGPWDAYFVVFNPLEGRGQKAELVSTNAESLAVVSRQADCDPGARFGAATEGDLEVTLRAAGRTYRGRAPRPALEAHPALGELGFPA